MDELVSIVVPIYNMESSLSGCIESLINQTYQNIEIILVDDGSTDNSLSVCHALQRKDRRVIVVHTENQGSGPARNEGIKVSKGNYLYFPDADDYIDKNTIEICVNSMSNGKTDLLVFGYYILSRDGKLLYTKKYDNCELDAIELKKDYSCSLTQEGEYYIQGAPWNKFFKSSLIKEHNISYPSLRRHQDDAFIARYMHYVTSVKFLAETLYTYYENDLNNQWAKFPNTYIDSVIGLYEDRKKNILVWNVDDKKTRDIVQQTFLSKAVIAMEQAYSPKNMMNYKQRLQFEKEIILKLSNYQSELPMNTSFYYRMIVRCIQANSVSGVDFFVWIRVILEKSGILNIKRYGFRRT